MRIVILGLGVDAPNADTLEEPLDKSTSLDSRMKMLGAKVYRRLNSAFADDKLKAPIRTSSPHD